MNNDSTKIIFKPNIYEINGKRVILDSDLAKCFNMETKRLNEMIKRNSLLLSSYEYFKLNKDEYSSLRSQNATLKSDFVTLNNRGKHPKYLPYAFTSHGVKKILSLFKKTELIEIGNSIIKMLEQSLIIKENQGRTIENLIYNVRGKQVMLDYDLARVYECQNGTKTVNLAVKRNPERFPEDFCFQLTKEEYENLRFQIETANKMTRTLPYAFTEQGVAMLATVLHTSVAAKISVDIMKAFVSMKRYISNNLLEQKYYNDMVIRHDNEIKILQSSFSKKEILNEVFFNGQIYDAYSKILDIFNEAKKSLIIIDNYADKNLLDIIRNLNIDVTIVTKKDSLLTKLDIDKYQKQYSNLSVVYNNSFHDRFFIIDNKKIYHCGTSINKIGYKTFAINKITDEKICDKIVNIVVGVI